ncbi:Transcriptional regulatory protein LiaR [compost metagenome]
MITIIIVEDHPEQQHFLKVIINNSPLFNCIGIYSNGKDAIAAIVKNKPDVVIMDIGLPDMSGVECIQQLKATEENVKFMVWTVFEEDENIFEALKAGASSYMVKSSKPYQIIDALLEMYNGDMPVSSCIATKLLNYLPIEKEQTQPLDYTLTKQEASILDLVAKGYSNRQLSEMLNIKITTLKWHIYNIYIKLKVKNRTEAIMKCFPKP